MCTCSLYTFTHISIGERDLVRQSKIRHATAHIIVHWELCHAPAFDTLLKSRLSIPSTAETPTMTLSMFDFLSSFSDSNYLPFVVITAEILPEEKKQKTGIVENLVLL